MKKILLKGAITYFLILLMASICHAQSVKDAGQLRVIGTQLSDQRGNAIALHGASLGWSCFHPRFYTEGTVKWLKRLELHNNKGCNGCRAQKRVFGRQTYV